MAPYAVFIFPSIHSPSAVGSALSGRFFGVMCAIDSGDAPSELDRIMRVDAGIDDGDGAIEQTDAKSQKDVVFVAFPTTWIGKKLPEPTHQSRWLQRHFQ